MTDHSTVQPAAHRSLQVSEGSQKLGGFDNLMSKELGSWFHARRWWVQLLIWVGIINVSTAFILFVAATQIPPGEEIPPGGPMAVQMVFSMMVIGGSIGTLIIAQDEMVGEKTSGTAAWILSKPVSRTAFILAKLLANGVGVMIFIVLIPAIIGYIEAWVAGGTPPAPGLYALGTAVAALAPLFYLTLSIMLGVLFDRGGPVIGIGLALLLGGSVVMNLAPSLAAVLPLALHNISTALVEGLPLPSILLIEIATTIAWIAVFVVVAFVRFEKAEL